MISWLLLLLVLILLGCAGASVWHGRYQLALVFLILGGTIFRLFAASDQYIHSWDERYHALVAKNLIEDPLKPMLYANPVLPYSPEEWTGNHVWLHKQPFPLWSMALSMSLFGVNEWALRLPSILLSLLVVVLTFYIARKLFNSTVAITAAFLASFSGLLIELAAGQVATDHIDVFFLGFVTLSVFFFLLSAEKQTVGWSVAAGIAAGAAILSKWLPALIVFAVAFCLFRYYRFPTRKMWWYLTVAFGACVAVFLPWQIYIHSSFPAEAAAVTSHNWKHVVEYLDGHVQPIYFHFEKLLQNYGQLIFLPILWFGWHIWKKFNWRNLGLMIWFIVPMLFFTVVKTKMQGYTLFMAPAVWMIAGFFIYKVHQKIKQKELFQWIGWAAIALLLSLPFRHAIERTHLFFNNERNPQWVQDIKAAEFPAQDNVVVFNAPHPIEMMFYRDVTAYSWIPEPAVIDSLKRQGFEVIIWQ